MSQDHRDQGVFASFLVHLTLSTKYLAMVYGQLP